MARAVVTGASTGIGWATVALLRQRGWDVTGVARRAERLGALAAETGADVFAADLTSDDDVAALRAHLEGLGRVDALVHNAGGARGLDRVEDGDPADWRWMFEANVIAVQRLTGALLPLLRAAAEQAGHATLLAVTSVAATEVYEGGAGYNAAKAGEMMLMRALRLELAGEPIRVIEIAPGMVQTEEFALNRFGGDADRAGGVYRGVENPLTSGDVADVIAYALDLPGHVNLDTVTIRPVAQAAAFKVTREPLQVRKD
ncbi:MAG: short-chain alcohol dehydrogenase [Naasia sp.]|jgi:NADP-dependent 3-hydroxy acid dehydrogenase YdfG|uniref:SDR family oxidoreductase n=1 Tax=Naasia sp. TaxID=2546198 RepID=UPI00261DE4CE|nr:SDR family oxidoreductase [Naasia sp.]MCU1569558.1 short-chain alcohol dehydrogenase [Naasia sp.]